MTKERKKKSTTITPPPTPTPAIPTDLLHEIINRRRIYLRMLRLNRKRYKKHHLKRKRRKYKIGNKVVDIGQDKQQQQQRLPPQQQPKQPTLIPPKQKRKVMDKRKSINIISLNVRTLRVKKAFTKVKHGNTARPEDKEPFLINTMKMEGIDIACLQETRLALDDGNLSTTKGFVMYNSINVIGSTVEQGRNGVGIMFREDCADLSTIKVYRFEEKEEGKIIFQDDRMIMITGKFKGEYMTIVSVYSPTNGSTDKAKEGFYLRLQEWMRTNLSMEYRNCLIVCGDFNARIGGNEDGRFNGCCGRFNMNGKTNDNGERLLELCLDAELVVANTIKLPRVKKNHGTWFHEPSKKWFTIDHILVSKNFRKRIIECEVDNLVDRLWSDHKPVRLKLELKKKFKLSNKPEKKSPRIYRDWIWLKEEMGRSMVLGEMTDRLVNEKGENLDRSLNYEEIIEIALKVMESIPKVEKKKDILKWNEEEKNQKDLKRLIQWRKNAQKKVDQATIDGKNAEKRIQRREVRRVNREIQRLLEIGSNNFYDRVYKNINAESTNFHSQRYWDISRLSYGAENAKKVTSNFLKRDGKLTKDDAEVILRLFEHTVDLLNVPGAVSENIYEYLRFPERLTRTSLGEYFQMWELCEAIDSMGDRKQTGEDEVPIEFFKLIPSLEMRQAMLDMINDNLEKGETPARMKDATVTFLHKKGNTMDTNNYRTLSMLSHVGKIQERMILRRLDTYAEETNAYGGTQQGFRHGRGCADAVFMSGRINHMALEKGLELYKLYVDNTKAFDCVSRDTLWMILRRRGIPEKLIKLTASMLENAKAKVKHNGMFSEEFELQTGLKQGAMLSPCLFNYFMGAIMDEIRRRLKEIESGVKINFNMECNPLKRSNGKDGNSRNDEETTIYDLLFADDSVFFSVGLEKTRQGAEIINDVMKVFGQKVSFPKTKVMRIYKKPKPDDEEEEIDDDEEEFLVDGNNIERVDVFKYLGTQEEEGGKLDGELTKRLNCMRTSYDKYNNVIFRNKHLRTIKKLQMFKCMVIPAGNYNCSCWNLTKRQMRKMNSIVRRMLMRLFGFKWKSFVSYDYIIKLVNLLGVKMIPMSIMIQKQRLKLLGHIVRMNDDRDIKKVLFGEIEGKRLQGKPANQWIDNIVEDLREFGISGNPKEDWTTVKELIEDRKNWQKKLEDGEVEAVNNWMNGHRERRKQRMIREGKIPETCVTIEGMDFYQCEDYADLVQRSPIELLPNGLIPNLEKKLGATNSRRLLTNCRDIGEGRRVPLDPHSYWVKPIVKVWIELLSTEKENCLERWKELNVKEARMEMRKKLVEEWLITSNTWDPVEQINEVFIIEDIRGFRKEGRKGMYLVEYAPRILEADPEYPIEMPEVRGLPWPLKDWLSTTELRTRIDGEDEYLKERIKGIKIQQQIMEGIRAVGAANGVIVVGIDVGGIPEG